MNYHVYGSNFSQIRLSRQQLIVTALQKSITDMLHIDELFLWLSQAYVHHFGLPVVQIWVAHTGSTHQLATELRAIAYENESLPQHAILNSHVAVLADSILSQQSDNMLVRISTVFPSSRAAVLSRYGLQYCSGHFLSSRALLPPIRTDRSDEVLLTPLAAAILLFMSQPLLAEQRESVEYIFKQAIQLAQNRGLLLPASEAPGQLSGNQHSRPKQPSMLAPFQLIPQRSEDADLMRSSNPLSASVIIADKQARRLYTAIDGSKNVQDLCTITHLDEKEAVLALQRLLDQHRIQLYDPTGQVVDSSLCFNDR